MARCAAGGITLSSCGIRYQLGLVFHAGLLILPSSAWTLHGTCESAMNRARPGATSAAKTAGNFVLSRTRIAFDRWKDGQRGRTGRRVGVQRRNGFALVGRECGDVHERRDFWIGASFGDDDATIRMTHEDDIAFRGRDGSPGDRDVVGQRGCWILNDDDLVAVIAQDAMDTGPAGSIDERAMNQNYRRAVVARRRP